MIELRNVTKIYDDPEKPAVNNLSFEVAAGETCVLIGPSGCGKTTTLKMVNRLVEPTSGSICVNGEDVLNQDPVNLRRHIGYVIQQVGLFPHMTVFQNIATVPTLLKWNPTRIDSRVDELLELVGMDPASYRERYPRELSGGQQQRVGVARALAADPPVLLMDEPFGAIDPITRENLQNEFLRLQRRINKTILFVTHDIDEALKMGTLICILAEGGIKAQFDTPANILARPADDFVASFVGADRGLKRLSLIRVNEVMDTNVPVARPTEIALDVTGRMKEYALDSMFVTDDEGKLLGTASLAVTQANPQARIDSIMKSIVLSSETESTVKDAFSEMLSFGLSYMPVVDEKKNLVGIITADQARQLIATEPVP